MELNNISWRKASQSSTNGGNCVEVARVPRGVAARDSKAPDQGELHLSVHTFGALVTGIRGRKRGR